MKILTFCLCLCCISLNIFAQQGWLTTGNSGTAPGTNFIGTTDAKDIVFKTNNVEHGRVLSSGSWRLGNATNFAVIDVSGKLSFGGTGAYLVGGNRYAFQYSGNPNYGLFFNSTNVRYELRDGNAQPIFFVNANTGDGYFKGKLGINTLTPAYNLDVAGSANFTSNVQAGSLKINNNGSANGIVVDDGGLSFLGKAAHLVNDNQFALLCNGEPGDGLYMNGDLDEWQFRDEQSVPYFTINEKTHVISSLGGLIVGHGSGGGEGYASIDSFGNLRFAGNASLKVEKNAYAIQDDSIIPGEGLFFNGDAGQWELRDSTETPVFILSNRNRRLSISGALQLGDTKNNVAGSIRFTGTDFEGYTGNAWRSLTIANNSWFATGNGGSDPSKNFIGTTDLQPLIFRTNNIEAFRVNGDGKVGIGTSAPGNYSVKINHGSFGLDLANAATGLHWEHFVNNTGDMLLYYNAGNLPIGSFNRTNGVYSALSDERMKANIQPLQDILEKISSLKTVSYNFKTDKERKLYIGLIAQDVEKIFPSLVTHVNNARSESYLLDYSGFGVIAIKGVQELKQQNDDLKKEVEDLKKIVLILQAQMQNIQAPRSVETVELGMSSKLDQNIPNPFRNTTTINYYLPNTKGIAYINFYSSAGALLKSVKLSSGGKGTLEVKASELPSGTYQYSLVVDGKIIDTKQMVQIK